MAGIAYTDAQVNFGHFIIHALGARYHTPTVNCAVLYSLSCRVLHKVYVRGNGTDCPDYRH